MADKRVLEASVISHVGCEREGNEDNFFFNGDYMSFEKMDEGARISSSFSDKLSVFAVCDGVGGSNYGERASYKAVKMLLPFLFKLKWGKADQMIDEYCAQASDEIFEDGRKKKANYQGTTLAMIIVYGDEAKVVNVGDSRVYRVNQGRTEQVSFDHSEVNMMRMSGYLTTELARKHPKSNVITRYVGMSKGERPKDFCYKTSFRAVNGDRIMICSDGVSDLIPEKELFSMLEKEQPAAGMCEGIVMKALEYGGKDNLTAIILDFKRGFLPA